MRLAEPRTIVSRDNPLLKRLRSLAHNTRDRRREQRTILDGVHLVETALEAGFALEHVVVSEGVLHAREVGRVLAGLPDFTDLAIVPESVFRPLSPVDSPSGIVALIALPAPALPPRFDADLLVLEGIQDPGNLGSILRTAAAVGIRDVVLTAGCAQAWSPRCLRAGMGGHFRLTVFEQVDALAVLENYAGTVLATALADDGVELYSLDLKEPVAWLFGSEGAGLSPELSQRADTLVRIPMPGATESLNVGAAVAVCLFEQLRQRAAASSRQT